MGKATETTATAKKLAYSVKEVCQTTSLSRGLIYARMKSGDLDYIKVGKRRVIEEPAILDFLSRMRLETAAQQSQEAR